MNIVVLNGIPDGYISRMSGYVEELVEVLTARGHRVNEFRLKEMKIQYCTGCFGCFVKTPGVCLIKDDAERVCREYIQSDLAIMASPVITGVTSALLKRVKDRLIPAILPFVELIQCEFHHPARYDKLPRLGLLLEKGDDTDDEDIDIITSIYERMVINLHSELVFTRLTDEPVEETCHAIDHI
jgi:multimeric flavodoxin WrbA